MSPNNNARNSRADYNSRAGHRRYSSVPSAFVTMTPPISPPTPITPSTPLHGINAVRMPAPAALPLPYAQSITALNRQLQPLNPPNPYEVVHEHPYSVGLPPPDYTDRHGSFDLYSGPASPISPVLHPSYPLAAVGDESPLDRWLRHEAMGRPIFPGSRTVSSIATSDISSVRGGMFGSLPGGRATGPSSRQGPGSTVSAETRDNFTSSASPYPSSRSGVSTPFSRDEDAASVSEGSYAPSVISSAAYPPSVNSRLQSIRDAPPPLPTLPTNTMDPETMSFSSSSSLYQNATATEPGVSFPESAAVRPPRYSDSLPAPPYQLPLAELLSTGAVGYQTAPVMAYGPPTAALEKAMLNEMLNNAAPMGQNGGAVVMVRQDVWQELRRRAGLDGGVVGDGPSVSQDGFNAPTPPARNGQPKEERIKKTEREPRCCGACIIC